MIDTMTFKPSASWPWRTSQYCCPRTISSADVRSTEMRSAVLSPMHHLRRQVDNLLTSVFPSNSKSKLSRTEPFTTNRVRGWTSLYEMVTFRPDVPYAEALRKERWQKGVVGTAEWVLGGVITGIGIFGFWAGRNILSRGDWRGIR